jgi:hypothetical protein
VSCGVRIQDDNGCLRPRLAQRVERARHQGQSPVHVIQQTAHRRSRYGQGERTDARPRVDSDGRDGDPVGAYCIRPAGRPQLTPRQGMSGSPVQEKLAGPAGQGDGLEQHI